MRPRTVLVLFVLVAALGAFVWLYERELPGSEERGERAKKLFPDLEADEVTRVVITSPEGTVEMERTAEEPEGEGREWRLVAPLQARADGPRLESLLSTLAGLEKARTLEDVQAADVGLAQPRGRVELATADGGASLLVGSEVPAGGGVIVGTGGAPPYFVVTGGLWGDLDRAPGDWRSPELFPGGREEIERVTVVHGTERLLLARRGEDFWIEAPYVDRAETAAVNRLLGALTGLRAERFLDQPPPDPQLGIAPPQASIDVVLRQRADPFRLLLGGPVPDQPERSYARTGEQTVEVGKALAEAVAVEPESWRSLAWASLEVFEIDRVELREGSQPPLVLERSEGDWLRDGKKIQFGAASDFLYALTGSQAQRVGPQEDLGEPRWTITLAGAERSETLTLYAAREAQHPARASDREVVLWLAADGVAEAEKQLAALRAAPLAESETKEDEPASDDADEGD